MADHVLQEFLARTDPRGGLSCACGKEHRTAVRHVLVEEHALESSAELLRRLYGSRPALWVLSDENTEAAAAARWKACVGSSRIISRVLPADPRPVPTLELAEELSRDVEAHAPDLLVAVGSGVVSDLVKKVSLDRGVPSWCVVTAPSVDAYSSATSALRVAGYHRAVRSRASEVIVCDLDVIRRAPPLLFLSGLGDLLAKLIASLDWSLARVVAGEHFCEEMAGFALGSARRALQSVREREDDPLGAARALTEAVLVSGFAMQASGGSRPAASAEHTIAHFWEMAGAVRSAQHDLHGILVGAASRLVLRGYAACYRGLATATPDLGRRLAAFHRERPWRERLEEGMEPFEGAIAEEMRGRVLDGAVLTRRVTTFLREREHILEMAEPLLAELAQAVELLEGLGFPFSLEELGISERHRLLAVRNVRLLRNRYTTFDLAYELGEEAELLGALSYGV